jgi:uncharacterized protein
MNVLIAGGTGFIGRALVLRLRRDGHQVRVYTRNAEKARALLGTQASFAQSSDDPRALLDAIEEADAVVNLAGEPLLGGRWTERKKAAISASRIGFTARIVEAIGSAARKPSVLVSGSAVGIYGNGGDRELPESAPSGTGFLADTCLGWEDEAQRAEKFGVRVVLLRTGVVLGPAGGALEAMMPAFRAGLGGPIGSGRQYVPWIHRLDLVDLICAAVTDDRWAGPINGVAPKPVTFREFAKAIGSALHRPSIVPVPSLAVRTLFGQAAVVLLEGQRAIPSRALELGFDFRFPTLKAALEDVLVHRGVSVGPILQPTPASPYLSRRPPKFILETRTELGRPLAEIFAFFSDPANLGLITPPSVRLRVTRGPERIVEGAEIEYSLRIAPFPLSWRTRIDAWESGRRFVDAQLEGPYASWWHEHTFEKKQRVGQGSSPIIMIDRVYYSPPLGPLGRVANHFFISQKLRWVFGYRASLMRLRFGDGS